MLAAAAHARRLSGARVLVVEDDSDLLQCVVDVLAFEGAAVQDARTGSGGFDAFVRQRPDVIVSDLWMPNGTGYDLIRGIRELPAEAGGLTPAIAVSAAENMERALMAGFHVFLSKPFDLDALVDTMADFVRTYGGQAEAPWTIRRDRERLIITFVGRVDAVSAGDIRAMTKALIVHLDETTVDVVADLRRLTSFAPSVASVGERAVWSRRDRISSLRVVGGSFLARLVSAAACKGLGVRCSFSESLDGSERPWP